MKSQLNFAVGPQWREVQELEIEVEIESRWSDEASGRTALTDPRFNYTPL